MLPANEPRHSIQLDSARQSEVYNAVWTTSGLRAVQCEYRKLTNSAIVINERTPSTRMQFEGKRVTGHKQIEEGTRHVLML